MGSKVLVHLHVTLKSIEGHIVYAIRWYGDYGHLNDCPLYMKQFRLTSNSVVAAASPKNTGC